MTTRHLVAIFLLSTFLLACDGASPSGDSLPVEFRTKIPMVLDGGLELVGLENRCNGCEPQRTVDYFSNDSEVPIKQEVVSVQAGYSAMYAYPGTHYFANTKIEQSSPGRYMQDKAILIDAIEHEYRRKKERVSSYLSENPGLVDRIEPHRAEGREYLTFERTSINGYEIVSYTENVIGLLSNTISQIHIFVPEKEITITAYLLRQEKSKFNNIEEFLNLRNEFINSYTMFLNEGSTGN